VSFVYLLVCACVFARISTCVLVSYHSVALLVFLLSHVKLFFLLVLCLYAKECTKLGPLTARLDENLDGNAIHVNCKKQTYIARDSDPAQRQVIPNQGTD
jgi:hypothetical protein